MSTSTLPGSPRLKLLAIPILGLVLLSRVWPAAAPVSEAEVARSPANAAEAATVPSGDTARPPIVRTWPKTELADLLQHNPFALPAALQPPPPVVEQPQKERPTIVEPPPAEKPALVTQTVPLESRRVSMVVVSSRGASAVVDSKLYRLHDYLEPGVQITEIRPNAVIVTRQAPGPTIENRQLSP